LKAGGNCFISSCQALFLTPSLFITFIFIDLIEF
jgi:hypothetical protein